MTNLRKARAHAERLAAAATSGDSEVWAAEARALVALDGRAWLTLDQAARVWQPERGPAVSGAAGWLGPSAGEATGFVAAVTSMHGDGRVRQRATRLLARVEGPLASLALAARLLDRAPQVRAEARRGVLLRRAPADVAAVLDVLLAGRSRLRAPDALALGRALVLDADPAADVAAALLHSERVAVRRWAFALAHERGVLTADRLLADLPAERDQWLRRAFARWVVEVAEPARLRPLLSARPVDARLVALTHLPDDALHDDELRGLLLDAAPRVREQARVRATPRGIDVAARYREALAGPGVPPRVVAACVDGLAVVGGAEDLATFAAALGHAAPRVRAAAASAVGTRAARDDVLRRLSPLLLDPSPHVALAAARALARRGAPRSTADAAWASDQPWSRRAAWRLVRGSGSWERVEADLRAAADVDPGLAWRGRVGVLTWLEHGASRTWAELSEAQGARIAGLLDGVALTDAQRRAIEFHAGLAPRGAR
ncbi:HEAT repeat domain-containing protein [Cellulomonas cellasea]|uniref:PBS lyase n=1 Tax=Cellulomonas cellasea TaxID=43670 RepID=A0A7W4YBT2_9CELL|nr:HEAT repeat domain-containing protein [Cellulomonas cellasea]MBB2924235.1 hypothetical protein [Cellulomonas cellasea]